MWPDIKIFKSSQIILTSNHWSKRLIRAVNGSISVSLSQCLVSLGNLDLGLAPWAQVKPDRKGLLWAPMSLPTGPGPSSFVDLKLCLCSPCSWAFPLHLGDQMLSVTWVGWWCNPIYTQFSFVFLFILYCFVLYLSWSKILWFLHWHKANGTATSVSQSAKLASCKVMFHILKAVFENHLHLPTGQCHVTHQ